MSSTEDHMRNAIRYLDPESELLDIDRARSEIRDALSHYKIEEQTRWKSNESINQT